VAPVREDESRLVVRKLEREARGIYVTLAGSGVSVLLVTRLALRMGLLWVAVLAGVGGLLLWTRLFRRLAVIRRARPGAAAMGAPARTAADSLTPARLARMLLAVLVSVGLCFLLFVWLSGKLR
jgi:hypothetical protein